jgi:hypothetical protein
VTVLGDRRGERRWPDVVIATAQGRRALELKFAPKATRRLERIIAGYTVSGAYTEVLCLVKNPALGRRIQRIAAGHGGASGATPIRVVPGRGCQPRSGGPSPTPSDVEAAASAHEATARLPGRVRRRAVPLCPSSTCLRRRRFRSRRRC